MQPAYLASATGSLETRRVRGVGFSSSCVTRPVLLGPSLTVTVSAGRCRCKVRCGEAERSPLLILPAGCCWDASLSGCDL